MRGIPFCKGYDPRRGVRRKQPTVQALTRAERKRTVEALCALRDDPTTKPETKLRVCALLLEHSDGPPGQHGIPTPAEQEAAADESLDAALEPPGETAEDIAAEALAVLKDTSTEGEPQ